MSPSLSHCRGPAPPFKTPLKPQRGLTSNCKTEDPAETLKLGHTDKFGLTDFKETLKTLDDSLEIRWLTEFLPLCLECQAFMSMGNQQGMKMKPNCHDYAESREASHKSPRFQIPRKRRRRVEGPVYTSTSQHNLRMTPATPRVPLKARRLTKLQITSSPTSEEWDTEEDRQIVYTPAARRKRVMGKERVAVLEETTRNPQDLKPVWRVKLPDASSAHFSFGKKNLFTPRNNLSAKKECALADSDTDLSEYDNDIYSTFSFPASLELTRKAEGSLKNTQTPQAERDTDRAKEAAGVEEKSSQRKHKEMGKEAAAQRVMGKIEEVEGIIRRVSLTSSDWIGEGSDEREEALSISDGCVDEEQHEPRDESGSQVGTQNDGCNDDEPRLVEELQALGEALSQSLRQVLKMEGAKAKSEPFTEAKKTSHKTNLLGSTKTALNLSPYSFHYTSTVPNNSSWPSLSSGGETSPVPSPSLSAILDDSQRTSSSFEGLSPILSPLLTSSQPSLPLSPTDLHEKDIYPHHIGWIGTLEDSLFSHGSGGCGSATAVSDGTGSDQKISWKTMNQTQTSRCRSETETSHDYLLSSGNTNYTYELKYY